MCALRASYYGLAQKPVELNHFDWQYASGGLLCLMSPHVSSPDPLISPLPHLNKSTVQPGILHVAYPLRPCLYQSICL